MPESVRKTALFIFVDRNAEYMTSFWRNVKRLRISSDQWKFINGVVSDTCLLDQASAFVFSPEAARDFGVPESIFRTWQGWTREHLLAMLDGFATSTPVDRKQWLAFRGARNRESYVKEIKVPCLTAPKLLAEAKVEPDRVVMTIVEADSGKAVMNSLLDMANFQPELFKFKLDGADVAGAHEIFAKLMPRGLEVGMVYAGNSSGTDSCIAIPAANVPPQFAGCVLPEACGPPDSRWSYLQDCLQNAVSTARKVLSEKGRPVILHVGPAELGQRMLFTDTDLHSRVLTLMPAAVRRSTRVVLVDPDADIDNYEGVHKLPILHSQALLMGAVVQDSCKSENLTSFRFGREAERDFGVPWGQYRTWVGPDKEYPLSALRGFATGRATQLPDFANWQKFDNAWNRSAYVKEVTVSCVSAQALLSKANVKPEDVAMVVFNTESRDVAITSSFLQLPRWRPGFIQYLMPKAWTALDNMAIAQRLRQHGLEVGRTYGVTAGQANLDNVIAVPVAAAPPPLLTEPDFVACDKPAQCGPPSMRWRHMNDVLQSIVQKMRDVLPLSPLQMWQRPPVILQIGSGSLTNVAEFSGVNLFKAALPKLPDWLLPLVRVVLVDTVAEPDALQGLRQLPVKMPVQSVRGKVRSLCPVDTETYYRFSRQLEKDFGVPYFIFKTWLRPSTEAVLGALRGYIATWASQSTYAANWAALHAARNASSYVLAVNVPCLTIEKLLQESIAVIESLSMVVFDTEESDTMTVEALLNEPSFKPGYLQFDLKSHWNSSRQQYNMRLLKSRGYSIGITQAGTSLIAVPKRHEPAFSVCTSSTPCGPAHVRSSSLQDIAARALSSIQNAGGAAPNVVLRIGSDGLVARADVDLWVKGLMAFPEEFRRSAQVIYVDSNERRQEELWKQANRVPLATSQAQFVSGMVLDACRAKEATMFNPSRAAERQYGIPFFEGKTLSLELVRAYGTWPGYLKFNWNRFAFSTNRSAYGMNFTVPCFNVSMVLAKAQKTPSELGMVVVDSERVDTRIVSTMLDLPGFRPSILQYGLQSWDDEEHQVLVAKLQSHGFEVGRTYPVGSDAPSVLAIHS